MKVKTDRLLAATALTLPVLYYCYNHYYKPASQKLNLNSPARKNTISISTKNIILWTPNPLQPTYAFIQHSLKLLIKLSSIAHVTLLHTTTNPHHKSQIFNLLKPHLNNAITLIFIDSEQEKLNITSTVHIDDNIAILNSLKGTVPNLVRVNHHGDGLFLRELYKRKQRLKSCDVTDFIDKVIHQQHQDMQVPRLSPPSSPSPKSDDDECDGKLLKSASSVNFKNIRNTRPAAFKWSPLYEHEDDVEDEFVDEKMEEGICVVEYLSFNQLARIINMTQETLQILAIPSKPTSKTQQTLNYIQTDHTPHSDQLEALFPSYPLITSPTYIVIPRPSTISPFSSKATDIARICGLTCIKRVEYGILYNLPKDAITYDLMTQVLLPFNENIGNVIFGINQQNRGLIKIGRDEIETKNSEMGLALTDVELSYLRDYFKNRKVSDVELMSFAQVNSEHCRHKIFNATWTLNGLKKEKSLFSMIRNTYNCNNKGVLSAYSDNAAVLEGPISTRFSTSNDSSLYATNQEHVHTVAKVETHNHPTAVSPYPGAATGSGGEIRDEGSVGRGSKPKSGLTGFMTSNLNIPSFIQPWETPLLSISKPAHISSALDIMLQAPLGAASFNNEFGRPAITGFFRTFLETDGDAVVRGYHKPIMIAGGVGSVREMHVTKGKIPAGALLVVLGGPGMVIGLGGGAASSQTQGTQSSTLDYASVQRENPEMQRRAQCVIDSCTSLGEGNPMISIHDVGAGGLSNALPELVHDSGLGAVFQLRDIAISDANMSPLEVWCNESQERYVMAINPGAPIELFKSIAQRERCPYSIVGIATTKPQLILHDSRTNENVIDLPMEMLFGKPPKMEISKKSKIETPRKQFNTSVAIKEISERVLRLACVASKSFLISIGDRSVGGMIVRDQYVGPWQVPVADAGVTSTSYTSYTGQAISTGEKPILSLTSPAASCKMAVVEALTNLICADVRDLSQVRLSANWMADAAHDGCALFEGVESIGMELCPELGLCIPVGKDSMSMKTKWTEEGKSKSVTSPLSLVITAYGNVTDIRKTLTPEIRGNHFGSEDPSTTLIFIDLSMGKQRTGCSALTQVYNQFGDQVPTVESTSVIKSFWGLINDARDIILAYHDRSDGGLFVTVLEMCFAGHTGVKIDISDYAKGNVVDALFNEELGAVVEVPTVLVSKFIDIAKSKNFPVADLHLLGKVLPRSSVGNDSFSILNKGEIVFHDKVSSLQSVWTENSYQVQRLRDNPVCADAEFNGLKDFSNPGLDEFMTYEVEIPVGLDLSRPKVAILREQGVNGHVEMAWAFHSAGFDTYDIHMSDLINGKVKLSTSDFRGVVFPGGFSYGDVLGAGVGWAKTILMNKSVSEDISAFFNNEKVFVLGVCNGCQMLSNLASLVPGVGEHRWPKFVKNSSAQFEARICQVKVLEPEKPNSKKCLFLKDMDGSILPISVAHGEGRTEYDPEYESDILDLAVLSYRTPSGEIAGGDEYYPYNPNGSKYGITGVTSPCGRFLAMMPHPERVVRNVCNTWKSKLSIEAGVEYGPWMQMFFNARKWCDETK